MCVSDEMTPKRVEDLTLYGNEDIESISDGDPIILYPHTSVSQDPIFLGSGFHNYNDLVRKISLARRGANVLEIDPNIVDELRAVDEFTIFVPSGQIKLSSDKQ